MGEISFVPESETNMQLPKFEIQGGKREFQDPQSAMAIFRELEQKISSSK